MKKWIFCAQARVISLGLALAISFSSAVHAAGDTKEIVLAGSTTALTRSLDNLSAALSQRDRQIVPDDVQISLQRLRSRVAVPAAGSAAAYLDADIDADKFQAALLRLEGMLGRRLQLTDRHVSNTEMETIEKEFGEASEPVARLLKALGEDGQAQRQITAEAERIADSPVAQERFQSARRLLLESVTNRSNLIKAGMRFAFNTTLVALSFHYVEHMPPQLSLMLAASAGGLSCLLMAGNDFNKAFVASPFWTRLPTQAYARQLADESAADRTPGARYRSFRNMGVSFVKDALIVVGFIGVFQTIAAQMGVVPATWNGVVVNFLKAGALTVATETSFNLINSHLTQTAIERLPPDDPALVRSIRRIRNQSSTAAFIQSPITTAFQMLAAMGSTVGETALCGLSAVGAVGYYVLVFVRPDSIVGRARDNVILPFLGHTVNQISSLVSSLAAPVVGSCQWLYARFR